jgi:probable rRNA maturation factor
VNLSLNRSDESELPWLDDETVGFLRQVGRSLGPAAATVNLVVVDDRYIREINREFRDIDKPTDVISFSYLDDDGPAPKDDDHLAGEVYISYQTIEKEAKELGVASGMLFLRAGVHGLLHVVGYDHAAEDDATRMEQEERSILSGLLAPTDLEALY